MAGKVKSIPAGYHAVTPCLAINGAARAIEFYKRVFGATELMRFAHGDNVRAPSTCHASSNSRPA